MINEIRKNGFGEAITKFVEGENEWANVVYTYISGRIYDVIYDAKEGWMFKIHLASGIFICAFNDSCLLYEGDWVEVVGTLRAATSYRPSYVQVIDMCMGEKGIRFSYAVVPYPTICNGGLQAKFNPNYASTQHPELGVNSGIFYKDPNHLFIENATYAMGRIESDRGAILCIEEMGST